MKENKYLFISIIFFIFLGYYGMTRYNYMYIKKISMLFLVGLTLIYGIKNYRKLSRKDLKLIKGTIFNLLLIPKYYLGFYIVLISKGLKRKQRVFYYLCVSVFFYLLTILIDNLGILQEREVMTRNIGEQLLIRDDLGFGHPNTTMMTLLPIIFLVYYVWYEKNKIKVTVGILIISQIIYKLTNSRTGYLLTIIFVFSFLIKDRYLDRLKYFAYSSIFFLLYFSFGLPSKLKYSFYDKLVSGRFRLFDYYLTHYEITLFGNKKITEMYGFFPLDNTYVRILFEQGIVGLIVAILLVIYIFRLLYRNKDYKAIRIFVVTLIFGVMEGQAFNYYFNVIYLIIYEYLIGDEILKNEEDKCNCTSIQ